VTAGVLVLATACALVAGLFAGRSRGGEGTSGATVLDGRSPRVTEGERVRVLVGLRRPPLGGRSGERLGASEQRAYVRSLHREARALQSALRARGVSIERPVELARVWSGFAATVAAEDLPEIETLGARTQRVRRFFPAVASARPLSGRVLAQRPSPPATTRPPALALLDSGVDRSDPTLGRRAVLGHDAVGGARRGEHGTELAGVVTGLISPSERLLSVRVAGLRRDPVSGAREEYGTTDELIAGLERTVDPDGDGDTEDAVPVALVGVNSPYAGFARSPEARAALAALDLGTLVVAPAGNEGPRTGRFGTIGSPAGAPAVLAVGATRAAGAPGPARVRLGLATRDGRALLEGTMLGGEGRALRAPATGLVGPSQADPRARRRAGGARALEYFGVDARPRAGGAVVVIEAGQGRLRSSLAPVVAAAAQAGAAALVLCSDGALPGLPRGLGGAMPVIGLSGDEGRRALELTDASTGTAFLSAPSPGGQGEGRAAAATSSQGPTYALAAKPDLAAAASAATVRPGARRVAVAGTSVSAAHAAAEALELHRLRPAARAVELAAALVGTARRTGPALEAGAGVASAQRAASAQVLATRPALTLRGRAGGPLRARLGIANPGPRAVSLALAGELDGRTSPVTLTPATVRIAPRSSARVTVEAGAAPVVAGSVITGRVRVRGAGQELAVPLALAVAAAAPPVLGTPRLVERGRRVRGVRFSAGRVTRNEGSVAVEPLGRLRLELLDARGAVARELTPVGGATDVLPGEYAYTLSRSVLSQLGSGSYRFRASASGTAGGGQAVRRSAPFAIP